LQEADGGKGSGVVREVCENDESGESGAEWEQAVQGASGSGAELQYGKRD